MSALATKRREDAGTEGLHLDGMRLSGLLAAMADRSPNARFIADQDDRDAWSGRSRGDYTFGEAQDVVRRLALFFASLGLPPGAAMGLCLANSSEGCLAVVAAEQAGFVPCLLPLSWGEDALLAAIESANIQIIVTHAAINEEHPAQTFCRIALRYFGLRFLCAFGPEVPDGVLDLDRVIRSLEVVDRTAAELLQAPPDSGLVTFSRKGTAAPVAHHRTGAGFVTAAMTFLVAARIEPGDVIVSMIAPDDLKGLVVGPIAALLSGASLECHGLFDPAALSSALARAARVHLVAPGWMEQGLADAGLPDHVASVILLHDAPARFKARPPLKRAVVDMVAFGEQALITKARDSRGQFALSLDEEDGPAGAATRTMLRVRREADGGISFAGPAAETREFDRNGPRELKRSAEWRPSGFKADLFAGIVIGIS
jgi:mycobactin salicyl-AMP ligase